MKLPSYLAVAVLFLCLVLTANSFLASAAEVREWKSADGKFKVEAKFVEQNADEVTIERKDGKKVKVPKAKLTANDQAYLKEMEKEAKGGNKASSEAPQVVKENLFRGESFEARQERIKKLAIEDANFDPSEIMRQIHEPPTLPDFQPCFEFDCSGPLGAPLLRFSEDGKRLLMMSGDKKKRIFVIMDLEKKTELRRSEVEEGPLSKIEFSKHGKYIAVSTPQHIVKVYDPEKSEPLTVYKTPADTKAEVLAVWFDPSETHVLFFDSKRKLYRYPIGSEKGAIVVINDEMCSEDHSIFIKNSICCAYKGNSVYVASRQRADDATKGPASIWATTIEIIYPDDKDVGKEERIKTKILKMDPPVQTPSNVIPYRNGIIGATNLTLTFESIATRETGTTSANESVSIRGYSPNSIHYIEPSGDNLFGMVMTTGSTNDPRRGVLLNYVYLHEPVPVLTAMSPDAPEGYTNGNFLSNDGSVVQYSAKERKLRVLRASKVPQHAFWRLLEFTKKAYTEGRYKRLEILGKALLDDTQPIADMEFQSSHRAWLVSLITNSAGIMPRQHAQCMDEWKRIIPESPYPDLALAQALMNEAWEDRGRVATSMLSDEKLRKFRELTGRAYNHIKTVLGKEDAPPEVYEQLFRYAQGAEWKLNEYEPHVIALMQNSHMNVFAHCQFANTLLPHWRGEKGDAAKYAAKIADKIGGDEGNMIYARIALSIFRLYRIEDFYSETELDIDRALDGCDAYCKKYPESGAGQIMGMALIFHHPEPNAYLSHLNRYAEFFEPGKKSPGMSENINWARVPINISVSGSLLYYLRQTKAFNRDQ